jgi:hypothetical protein
LKKSESALASITRESNGLAHLVGLGQAVSNAASTSGDSGDVDLASLRRAKRS